MTGPLAQSAERGADNANCFEPEPRFLPRFPAMFFPRFFFLASVLTAFVLLVIAQLYECLGFYITVLQVLLFRLCRALIIVDIATEVLLVWTYWILLLLYN